MAQLSDHSVLGVAVGPLLILDFLEGAKHKAAGKEKQLTSVELQYLGVTHMGEKHPNHEPIYIH